MLGWIFFRVQSVNEGLQMLMRAFDFRTIGIMSLRENQYFHVFLYLMGMLAVAGAVKLWRSCNIHRRWYYASLTLTNGAMLFWVFLMLKEVKQFIYFQF